MEYDRKEKRGGYNFFSAINCGGSSLNPSESTVSSSGNSGNNWTCYKLLSLPYSLGRKLGN